MKILLTNDDGASSPFLRPLAEELHRAAWCNELRVVVPTEEQSWIAQSMTRFRPLYATPHQFGGASGYVVSGTPADCSALGLYSLYPEKADLVISGINVGTNAGFAFYLSSGTVGGARQAMLAGVFSMAFSVRVPDEIFDLWREEDRGALSELAADWQRLARIATSLAERAKSLTTAKLDMLLFDLPWEATEKTPVRLTYPERRIYGPLHRRTAEGSYLHQFSGLQPLPPAVALREKKKKSSLESDLAVAVRGEICVSPICYDFSIADDGALAELAGMLAATEHSAGGL